MSWQKFSPDELAWQEVNDHHERVITTEPYPLTQKRIAAQSSWSCGGEGTGGILVLLLSGELRLADGHSIKAEDLLWVPAGASVSGQCLAEVTVFELHVPKAIGPGELQVIEKAAFTWQDFEDPAGRPTQPVQVLMEGNLSVLRTRFQPDFTASDHWHDFDTWYFITDGSMRFGHEGIYKTGQVRQVSGGYSYGPEEPGEEGVEFVLVSVGGAVVLHWADLEQAPHGALA